MSRRKYMYLLQRIKESHDWSKGIIITSTESWLPGWRCVGKIYNPD